MDYPCLEVDSHINELFSSVSYHILGSLIDAGDEWSGFNNVKTVLLTHAHFDHIYGLNKVIEMNPCIRVFTNEYGREMLLDAKKNLSKYYEKPFVISNPDCIKIVENQESVDLENGFTAKAIFTPGHNPSCITWIMEDCLFTGDAYIPGIKTVTNLPRGNKAEAARSEEIIKQLAIGHRIFPGHYIG